METVIVAVASKRQPKLGAVAAALPSFSHQIFPGAAWEIAGEETSSGVRHTPLSKEEIMQGAKNRAEFLVKLAAEKRADWKFFVGLEGGLDVVQKDGRRWVFLENWAYVTDGLRGAFGGSGSVLMPEPLVRSVVDEGQELGHAIDIFAGGRGIRDAEGAWGILTGGRITRQEAFRVAIINAFSPFYNRAAYDAERAAANE
ncbi:MAG TPA: inosine/xanthosine triphosphatase [Candidatus Acidoferrum sp.]|nr:inosine/xanthosine triphosphatase [Candidatus Acidoferrum sp.]